LSSHVCIRFDSDNLFGASRPDAGRQPGPAPEIDDQSRAIDPRQLSQDVDDCGRRLWPKGIILIGKAAKAFYVRLDVGCGWQRTSFWS
jgi:hypothetical protein